MRNKPELEQLISDARSWIEADPDPVTSDALGTLVERSLAGDDEARESLVDRFAGRLSFGTAGLRAEVGAGPMRMNRLVVRQTTAGLVSWLAATTPNPTVVIGHDARHGSVPFARDAAAVVAAAGGRALLLPRPLPTPVLAYAVVALGGDAGIMVTASHNPPADNGYKVYASDGAQIVPPADSEIAVAIDRAAAAPVPVAADDDEAIVIVDDTFIDDYLDAVAALRVTPEVPPSRVVYTAMHGVGYETVVAAFARAGLEPPIPVPSQVEPDPDFPTVDFPNPEEPGALDLAVETATAADADVILASDPDADRLGMAVPSRDGDGWQILRGDEIGVLLADHLLRHSTGSDRLVATTIVSSTLLEKMAAAADIGYGETLTGFKWLARLALSRPDREFVLGYEEALGYSIGSVVRDKDGVSAAVVAAEMVADLAAQGQTVHDRLDALATEHGVHLTDQVTVRFDEGIEAAEAVMVALRADPPTTVGGHRVERWADLADGGELPPSNVVILQLNDGARLIIRPSGTEPKLKAYLEIVEPVSGSLDEARTAAVDHLAAFRTAVVRLLGQADDIG